MITPHLLRSLGIALMALLLSAGATGCSDRFPPPTGTAPSRIETWILAVPGGTGGTRNLRLTLPDGSRNDLMYGELIRYDARAKRMILGRDPASIVIAGIDGSEASILPDSGTPRERLDPKLAAVSPDGRRAACIVARSAMRGPGHTDDSVWLRIVDLGTDSTISRTLLINGRDLQSDLAFSAPGFSPDGGSVALFTFDPTRSFGEILIVPVDAPDLVRTSRAIVVDGEIITPSNESPLEWSQDGKRIAFTGLTAGVSGMWNLLVADTASLTTAAHITAVRSDGRIDFNWSPKEPIIALSGLIYDDLEDLWLFDLNTGGFTRLMHDTVCERAPVWSRDGSEILYIASSSPDASSPGTLMTISPWSTPHGTRTIADGVIKAFWE